MPTFEVPIVAIIEAKDAVSAVNAKQAIEKSLNQASTRLLLKMQHGVVLTSVRVGDPLSAKKA